MVTPVGTSFPPGVPSRPPPGIDHSV